MNNAECFLHWWISEEDPQDTKPDKGTEFEPILLRYVIVFDH